MPGDVHTNIQKYTAYTQLKVRTKMQRKVILSVLCGVLALAGPASAGSLEEILAKNLEVRGGEDAILAVQTTRSTGTMRMGGSAAG